MGGKKKEYALTKKGQPVILAAFYNAGLCASPDYMTIEEAGLINDLQFDAANFKDAAEDFSGFRYFTGITSISATRFDKYNITSVVFPNTITDLGNFTFNECKLVTAVVNDAITTFPYGTFRFNMFLKEVVLGSSVTSIPGNTFTSVNVLESFVIKTQTPPTLGSDAIQSNAQFTVYVPDSAISDYQAAENWSNYTIKGISEYNGSLKDYVL